MKSICALLNLLIAIPALGATYTVSAPHLTMHAGDPLPPLVFNISSYPGAYASVFTGEPARHTSATASSTPGDYPITISQGTLKTVNREDTVKFVNGTLTVLPAGPTGAHLRNDISYPPGFLHGPQGSAVIDVTHNAIANLVPDCKTDNADAFNTLLAQNGQRTAKTTRALPMDLYFPPGCYATSQPLTIYGNTWTIWGSGPQRSYIRLLPNSPAFNTGKDVQFFSPQSVNANANFREYAYNIGIDIGVGNPNAIPFTTVQNNSGAVRNVQIWADDSNCPFGISFRRAYPGPMLFKDVAVYGCKSAYSALQNEYSITIEGFTTEAQTDVALDNRALVMSIRHWLSDNPATALHVWGGASANVSVLDSEIRSSASPAVAGLTVDKGSSLFLKNLSAKGYSPTESDGGAGTPVTHAGEIRQAWTGSGQSLFDGAQSADTLHLPVRETPQPNDPPVGTWTQLSGSVNEWPAEIQNSRSSTVYAAPGLYPGKGVIPVDVPDTVDHIQFYQAKLVAGGPKLVITVGGSSPKPLIIEGCLYASCQIVHNGRRAVVLSDEYIDTYTARDGAGDLYIEDSLVGSANQHTEMTVNFFPSQHIWARQLNMEQKGVSKLHCSGCTLWILGYKTETPTPSIELTDHARAEIFGFFFYQNVGPTAPGTANVYMTDSSIFATGFTKVDKPGRGQPFWVLEQQHGKKSSLATHDVDTSQQLNMFYSYGGGRENGDNGKGDRGGKKDQQ